LLAILPLFSTFTSYESPFHRGRLTFDPPARRLSDAQRHVRARLTVRDVLVRTRTRYISVMRALLRQHGGRVPSGSAAGFPQRVMALPLPGGSHHPRRGKGITVVALARRTRWDSLRALARWIVYEPRRRHPCPVTQAVPV